MASNLYPVSIAMPLLFLVPSHLLVTLVTVAVFISVALFNFVLVLRVLGSCFFPKQRLR